RRWLRIRFGPEVRIFRNSNTHSCEDIKSYDGEAETQLLCRNVLVDSRPIMKANKAFILPGLVVGLLLSGCNQKAPPRNQATVFRLFDLFQPEDLTGKVTLDDAGW